MISEQRDLVRVGLLKHIQDGANHTDLLLLLRAIDEVLASKPTCLRLSPLKHDLVPRESVLTAKLGQARSNVISIFDTIVLLKS